MKKEPQQQEKKANLVRKNEQIRHPLVLVVYEGERLGEMSSRDACYKARNMGLDLVEISANGRVPVCRIVDYGKWQYEQGKKKQKGHIVREKEFVMRYVIDDNDLTTKMNQARKYLLDGDKVKITVKFEAREKAHKDRGFDIIKQAVAILADCSTPEKDPAWEGSRLFVRLSRKKSEKAVVS